MLTLGCNPMMTYFTPINPFSIKYLLLRVKLALGRTTRLQSSANSLKCAKLFDFYEYGLETQANP